MPERAMKRNRILYLGLDPSRFSFDGDIVHQPLIKTIARPCTGSVKQKFENLHAYTHILFTSRTAISLFLEYASEAGCSLQNLKKKMYIAIGKASAALLKERGLEAAFVPEIETAEGIVDLLKRIPLTEAHLFFPRSAQGRDLILVFLKERGLKHATVDLYDTFPSNDPLPNLEHFDKIVLTSPSIVHAFFQKIKESIPPEKFYCIGPVTQETLFHYLRDHR